MIHYIYKHENKINGKCYIGQTKNMKWRKYPSCYVYCTKFFRAINKYGWNNFTHEILKECTENDVDYWEAYYIQKYNSIENGYNLESGGKSNQTVSKETKQKIREANLKRVYRPTGKPAWNKGLKLSDEYRKKLSDIHKGKRKPLSQETKIKIAESNKGKKRSAETKRKLSEAHKGKPSNNKGKTFSQEWRKNISEAHKGIIPVACCKKIKNIDTGLIFNSIAEASRFYNINSTHISSVAKGKRLTAGGYCWEYITEN